MLAAVRRPGASACAFAVLIWGSVGAAQTGVSESSATQIPAAQVTTLDGHTVSLPRQLPGRATVLIVGFGRRSQSATTAWEKPVRLQLAHTPAIGFYDLAMLAEIPSFVRPLVLRGIHHTVPDVLKPNFIPLTDQEDAWKRVSGYAPDQPEAAYVLVVDRSGIVRWSTHAAFTAAEFGQLSQAAQQVASQSR